MGVRRAAYKTFWLHSNWIITIRLKLQILILMVNKYNLGFYHL